MFFFFNDTATTEIYTLSLHDALPISYRACQLMVGRAGATTIAELTAVGCPALLIPFPQAADDHQTHNARDWKSTRLNSSHSQISYAVFCLKKKKRHHN